MVGQSSQTEGLTNKWGGEPPKTPGRSTRTSPREGGQGRVGVIEPPASPRRGEESWVPGGARREARARQPQPRWGGEVPSFGPGPGVTGLAATAVPPPASATRHVKSVRPSEQAVRARSVVGGGVAGGEAGSPGVGSRLQTTRTTRRGKGLGPRGQGAHRSARTTPNPRRHRGARGERRGRRRRRQTPPPATHRSARTTPAGTEVQGERPQATTESRAPRETPPGAAV